MKTLGVIIGLIGAVPTVVGLALGNGRLATFGVVVFLVGLVMASRG